REGRVQDPHLAEFLEEVGGHPEHAAPSPDVLSEDEDAVVGLHLLPQRVVDGLDEVLLGHGCSPGSSANRCSNALSGSGSGAFHASSTSRSISAFTTARSCSIRSSSRSPSCFSVSANLMRASLARASSTSSRLRYV